MGTGKPLLAARVLRNILVAAILIVALTALFSALLALFVVPAPSPETAVEVSGYTQHLSHPHPEYGDLSIILQDGRRYYVNRANEIPYFAWQRLLAEVQRGDIVTLTVVRPLAWRLLDGAGIVTPGPVAGVRTNERIYMDPQIPSTTWSAQQMATRWTFFFAGLFVAMLVARRFLPRS
jgi:hypothetical protein